MKLTTEQQQQIQSVTTALPRKTEDEWKEVFDNAVKANREAALAASQPRPDLTLANAIREDLDIPFKAIAGMAAVAVSSSVFFAWITTHKVYESNQSGDWHVPGMSLGATVFAVVITLMLAIGFSFVLLVLLLQSLAITKRYLKGDSERERKQLENPMAIVPSAIRYKASLVGSTSHTSGEVRVERHVPYLSDQQLRTRVDGEAVISIEPGTVEQITEQFNTIVTKLRQHETVENATYQQLLGEHGLGEDAREQTMQALVEEAAHIRESNIVNEGMFKAISALAEDIEDHGEASSPSKPSLAKHSTTSTASL